MLRFQPVECCRTIRPVQTVLRCFQQPQVERSMRELNRVLLAAHLQALQGILAYCLQHGEARFSGTVARRRLLRPQQTLVKEARQTLDRSPLFLSSSVVTPLSEAPPYVLRRLHRKPAGEDGQTAEQRLLLDAQEIMAPADRVAHGALSIRGVT